MEKLNIDIEKFDRKSIDKIAFTSVKTGIELLDNALSGGLRPGLTVLGALPGTGKSTLAYQIARNVSSSGTPVIIYSLEMTRNQILAKMISRQTFINSPQNAVSVTDMLNANRNRFITGPQWDNIISSRQIVARETENIFITEGTDSEISAAYICDEVADFITSSNASPFVIVDYLQFLAPNQNKSLSDKQAVDDNIRMLASLASEYKICVLLISSVNRSSYRGKITMLSFKESGSIEYSADTLIGMDRVYLEGVPESEQRTISLSFLKQRYGRADISIQLKYDPRFDCFTDCGTQEIRIERQEEPAQEEASTGKADSGNDISEKKKRFFELSED